MIIRKKKLVKILINTIDQTAKACGRNLSEKQKLTILNRANLSKKDLKYVYGR